MDGQWPWTCRPLTMEDVPGLLDWYNDRHLHEIANTSSFSPYTLDELIAYWKKKLSRSYCRYFVLEIGERLIGRVGLKKTPPVDEEVEFSILIGVYELQGQGIGTAVTRHMVELSFDDPNVQTVKLHVRRDNQRAQRCYEKVGFRTVHSFTQNGVPTELMQIKREEWTAFRQEERKEMTR